MKAVRNFVFSALLVSALAANASAGDQETPGYVPPPPTHSMSISTLDETTLAPVCEEDTQLSEAEVAETSDYLLVQALALLLSVF